MIRLQSQKNEQKKNKYVKHNQKVQNIKKIGGAVAGAGAAVVIGVAKHGKDVAKYAPKVAKVVVDAAKMVVKI